MADAPELKPVYLLTGSDRPKISRALERLRARFDPGAIEVLAAVEATGDDAVAACNAMGLFGSEGRLVVVEGVGRWKADDAAAVSSYLADPSPGSVLALVGDEVRRDSALAKAAAKHGDLLTYDVSKRDLPRWVGEQFALHGAEADPSASRLLVDVVGDDLIALASEVEKLAAWAAGNTIDEEAVELLAAPHGDAPLFALTDAWGTRETSTLLEQCELALERSPNPVSSTVPRLVGTLTHHVVRVAKARRLAEQGVRPADATKELGDGRRPAHRYVAEKAFAHARNYSEEELEDALVRLAALDLALKGASRLPTRLELERTLVEIS
jgi:DNA polymerase III subunit delta